MLTDLVDNTEEIQRRRTFAIISHPDAGKTTLTEKLLLYGGAVQLAGSVTARKNQRATRDMRDGHGNHRIQRLRIVRRCCPRDVRRQSEHQLHKEQSDREQSRAR